MIKYLKSKANPITVRPWADTVVGSRWVAVIKSTECVMKMKRQ